MAIGSQFPDVTHHVSHIRTWSDQVLLSGLHSSYDPNNKAACPTPACLPDKFSFESNESFVFRSPPAVAAAGIHAGLKYGEQNKCFISATHCQHNAFFES